MSRLSIVMPTLNQGAFLEAALASVFGQEVPFELVVVDGGSLDGTPSVLARWAKRTAGRLRWVSAPDNGPAAAVNRAVALSRGTWLGWLNSDDLYTPGALARAMAALDGQPGLKMVYGEAEHIDLAGRVIAPYPTRPPGDAPWAFTQGCFICQPTAFFRRDVFEALGGLDESLRAAFDFDLWLRLFAAHPAEIVCLPAVQAQSRLHPGGITLSQRETVAFEGLRVLRRHLDRAPPEWLLTHFAELAARHPFEAGPLDLAGHCRSLLARAGALLEPSDCDRVRQRLDADLALRLSTPQLQVAVWPDGWAPGLLEIRHRQPLPPQRGLRLSGVHAHPRGGRTTLTLSGPDGTVESLHLTHAGPFEWAFALPDSPPEARTVWLIEADRVFVPADLDAQSADSRELAWRLTALETLPG